MLDLVIILFGIVVVFGVTVYLGGVIITRGITRALTRQHRELDWILSTGTAPESWCQRYVTVLNLLSRIGGSQRLIGWLEHVYKHRLERRLFGLVKYFTRANVFPDEETRKGLLSRLRAIGKTWEAGSFQDVTGMD